MYVRYVAQNKRLWFIQLNDSYFFLARTCFQRKPLPFHAAQFAHFNHKMLERFISLSYIYIVHEQAFRVKGDEPGSSSLGSSQRF